MTMSDTQKTALNVYAMVAAGMVLMLIPVSLVPFAGLACMTVGFIAAYLYRARNKDNLFLHSHMRYIIRTVWWASLILIIGLIIFSSILVLNGDISMITDMRDQAERGVIPTESDIRVMQANFVHTNADLILIAAFLALLPYPLYIAWRMVKGIRSAVQGNEIASHK